MLEVTGSSSVRHRPLPTDDPTQRQPDITRARELLAGSRRSSFEGVERTVAYFRSIVLTPNRRRVDVRSVAAASASSRCARYQSIVERRPWKKSVRASKPNSSRGSWRRRFIAPVGLAGVDDAASKPVSSVTTSTSSLISSSRSAPRLTGSSR